MWASPPCTDISSAQTKPTGSGELILRWTVQELSRALEAAQVGLAPHADFVKNNSSSKDGTNLRPIALPSFTICASRQINWANGAGETTACMNVGEGACLMGFGGDLRLLLGGQSRAGKDAQRVIGNGVCRQVAEVIGRCARGDEPPKPEEQPPSETELLKRRVNELEVLLPTRTRAF